MKAGFFKNLILNNISQALQFGSRWFFSLFLLHVLTIENFGVYSFAYSISNILIPVITFGSQVYLINIVNNSLKEGKKELKESFTLVVLLTSVFLLLGIVYGLIFPASFEWLILLSIVLGGVFSLNVTIFSYVKSLGDFAFEGKIYGVSTILIVALMGVVYLASPPLYLIFIYLIIINILMFVLAVWANKNLRFLDLGFKGVRLKEAFGKRLHFGIQDTVTSSFRQGGAIIVFYLVSEVIYGEYRSLILLTSPFILLNSGYSQVLLVELKKDAKKHIAKKFHQIQLGAFFFIVFVLSGVYMFKGVVFEYLIKLPDTSDYLLPFLGTLVIIFSAFIYIGYEMMLVILDMQKFRMYAMIAGGIINLIAIFILLPKYGLFGAVLTNVISNVAVFVILVVITEISLRKLKMETA